MATLAEQIHQADRHEAEGALLRRVQGMGFEEKSLLIGYLKMIGELELAKELFGIDSLDIKPADIQIYVPDSTPKIYRGEEHGEQGWDAKKLTAGELNLLLSGFFHSPAERKYVIRTFFHEDRFVHKTNGDVMDYLQKAEELFQRANHARSKSSSHIGPQIQKEMEDVLSANDTQFTPLVDRIWDMEPGYFDFIHETYQARLDFVESLFIETVRHLAEDSQNHIWALDTEGRSIFVPPRLESKIKLIESVCEFHRAIDPHFPLLHTHIPSTLGAWILLYKGFSAPIHSVRKILGSK